MDCPYRPSPRAAVHHPTLRCGRSGAAVLSLSNRLDCGDFDQAPGRLPQRPADLDSERSDLSSLPERDGGEGHPGAAQQPDHSWQRHHYLGSDRQLGRLQPGPFQHRRTPSQFLAPLAADDAASGAGHSVLSDPSRGGQDQPSVRHRPTPSADRDICGLQLAICDLDDALLLRRSAGRDRRERHD